MNTFRLAFPALFLSLLAACAVGGPIEAGDDDVNGSDELSASSRTYVALRPDLYRKCMAPLCGGYFVHDVNRVTLSEKYVSGLDFSASGLAQEDVDRVTSAPAGELILRGKLGPKDPTFGTQTFIVSEAYRGMPGFVPATGDLFYQAKDRSPAISCLVAPCNNEVATKLNSTATTYFTGFDVSPASDPFVDQEWLVSRVESHAAVVAGHFAQGVHQTGGYESNLSASQVYVKIPERVGPCPAAPQPSCPTGQKATYTRSADRCVVFDKCVKPTVCPMFMPACPADYTLESWTSAPSACSDYACDPSFVAP